MATVRKIYQYPDGLAPFSLQMEFDSVGSLIDRRERAISKILVSLDVTEEAVEEVVRLRAELTISHHPVIFRPTKSVTGGGPDGRVLLALTEHGIATICTHTNPDTMVGDVNDALVQKLGLVQIEQLHQNGVDGSGRSYGIGQVGGTTGAPIYAPTFAAFVKEALGANGMCYADARRPVCRMAVRDGACADLLRDALALGCDTLATTNAKYNDFLDAKILGVGLIDAGHYPTEQVVCPVLAEWLATGFPQVEVLSANRRKEASLYL